MIVECPECEADVSVPGDSDMSDILTCEECSTDLEIVGLDPIEVEIVEDSFDEDYD
jgi:alpha-aminoadipate carrier protein LysW